MIGTGAAERDPAADHRGLQERMTEAAAAAAMKAALDGARRGGPRR